MNALRTGCFFAGSIVLSFAAGWYLHPPEASLRLGAPEPIRSPGIVDAPTRPTSTPAKPERPIDVPGKEAPSFPERLTTLRWLKANGMFVPVQVFGPDGISPQFALLYGLTSTEQARLNLAYQQAKQRLGELTDQRAQVDPATNDKKLIVSVPAFPTEGGRVYNELLAHFASVMGADRYSLFNETSGNLLERSLDGIGLESNRYEVTRGADLINGEPLYDVKRSFVYPDESGVGSGTSNSSLRISDLRKYFPVLRSYSLPVEHSSGSTPKN